MVHKTIYVGSCALAFFSGALQAQAPQDAGSILRQQQTAPATRPAQPAAVTTEPGSGANRQSVAAGTLTVQNFRFVGNVRFGEAELNQALANLKGRPLNFGQLSDALAVVQDHYRLNGFLARAHFPPQDVENGVVLIGIVEARVGAIFTEGTTGRPVNTRASDFITTRLAPGESFNLDALGAATAILNEQPGVRARARLIPGKVSGETDIRLQVEEESRLVGFAEANTFGSRATGRLQTSIAATAVNPLGVYDQLGAHATLSEGIRFVRLEYGLPIGGSGLRASVHVSNLDYRLTQDSLAPLDGDGKAHAWGAQLSMPLLRSERTGVTGWLAADSKLLRDTSLGVTLKSARINMATLGLSASLIDRGANPGTTDLAVALGQGQLKSADPIDVRGMRGSFSKLNWSLQRRQPLTGKWSLSASMLGQLANKNLDSAERIALGGPYAIRAYPIGEASGDEGLLFKLNLQYAIQNGLSASVFLEGGQVTLNHAVYAGWNAGNPNLPNRYEIAGAGLGLDYTVGKFTVSAALAGKIGKNPGRDLAGRDSDGSDSSVRGWLTARYAF